MKANKNIILPSDQPEITIPMALVQPFTEIKALRKKDKDLRLYRVQEKERGKAIFIPARSIIHAAYIIPEAPKEKTSLVVDVVDTDMFLRLIEKYGRRWVLEKEENLQ